MNRGALLRTWFAVALMASIANMAFASGSLRYFVCQGDSVARLECCCRGIGPAMQEATTRLESPCCCQVTRASGPAAPTVSAANTAVAPVRVTLAAAVPAYPDAAAPATDTRSNARAQAPPPRAVPVLLLKQSFLI